MSKDEFKSRGPMPAPAYITETKIPKTSLYALKPNKSFAKRASNTVSIGTEKAKTIAERIAKTLPKGEFSVKTNSKTEKTAEKLQTQAVRTMPNLS